MLVWKSQWLSGKVTAFRVEDCGSSPGLGAEARSGEAKTRSLRMEERVPEDEEEEKKKKKVKEGKRSSKKRKKVLFNSKYLDLKHNLCLFSSLSWQILLDHHLPPVPPVLGASPDSSPVPPTPSSTLQCPGRTRTGILPSWEAELLPLSHWDFHTNIAFFCAFVFFKMSKPNFPRKDAILRAPSH